MPSNGQKTCIVYCRVSTAKSAQEGESLDTQEGICRRFVEGKGYKILPEGRVFRETFSGRKDVRPALEEVFEYIRAHPGTVDYFVFRVIDRFTRGGSYSYEHIKKELARHGVEMIDTYGVIQPMKNTLEHVGFEYDWSRTSPSEVAEIVIANTAKAEVTNILTRMIGREIELTQQGFKLRAAVDGFLNKKVHVEGKKRVIQVPDPERASFYREMFALRAAGALSDKEIARRLNARGFRTRVHNRWDKPHERIIGRTGGGPLTVKRLQGAISRPIYGGILCEKWTHWKPIKARYDGLVSIETFNQANRGKVFIEEGPAGLEILYNHHPDKTNVRRTRNNPLFPYKNLVLCPRCNKPFSASCPRSRSGKRHPTYHCSRSHRYLGIPKKKFDEVFEQFVARLKFRPDAFDSLHASFLNGYNERKKEILQASADAHRTIVDLRSQQKAKSEAFVAATSPVLRGRLEKEIDDLEVMIKMASGESQKIDISSDDIERFKRYGKFLLEHLSELLLNPENLRLQTTLFSLVFEKFPTYEEIAFGTPKLSWIFELSSESATANSILVHLGGLSWNRIEETIRKWRKAFDELEWSGVIEAKHRLAA
ncbi:MAG TPA: recombinase family protein [Verrucomicrobiae bacterium]|nr:recombinase family protein [Verrucomicrobiae bacterium]